tara:strand:+ start:763 stop:1038 length:276 start_codon:yes stop_codon:yes gene_type:complete
MLKLEFANMAAHTALVEACDWDESQAASVIEVVSEFLDQLKPDRDMKWEDFRELIRSYMANIYGEIISDIIINILEAKADEVKFYSEIDND